MNTMTKSALLAGLALFATAQVAAQAQTAAPRPAAARPAAATPGLPPQGIAIADLEAIVGNADAIRLAEQQRETSYKPQIDAYKARMQKLEADLKPLVDKYNADSAVANPNQASLKAQADSITKIQQDGQKEAAELIRPYVYSQEYVKEQVAGKLNQAVRTAMTKNRVTLLLAPGTSVAAEPAHYLNKQILTELNLLIPTAQVIPPAGWEPLELRQQRAQQAAAQQQAAGQAQGAAPATPAPRPAQPAGPTPDGR